MNVKKNPILLALDVDYIEEAKSIIQDVHGLIGGVKLGLQFFAHNGPMGVAAIAALGYPIFLDLKLHDIPNTVVHATKNIAKIAGVKWLTIHGLGGSEMIKRAVEVAKDLKIIVVTKMTSEEEISKKEVLSLSRLASDSGAHGVVCSGNMAEFVRSEIKNPDFILICPGIRALGEKIHDQKDVTPPEIALRNGATHIVVGRSVTDAVNKRGKLIEMLDRIEGRDES